MVSPLKIERVRRGLSQFQLWMKTDVPPWRISLIERGLPPKPEEARKLAEALNLSVAAISCQGGENDNP
jgi:hypothetical protein